SSRYEPGEPGGANPVPISNGRSESYMGPKIDMMRGGAGHADVSRVQGRGRLAQDHQGGRQGSQGLRRLRRSYRARGSDRRGERIGRPRHDGLQGATIVARGRISALLGVRPGEARSVGPALAFAFLGVGAMSLAAMGADALFVTSFSLGALSRFTLLSA